MSVHDHRPHHELPTAIALRSDCTAKGVQYIQGRHTKCTSHEDPLAAASKGLPVVLCCLPLLVTVCILGLPAPSKRSKASVQTCHQSTKNDRRSFSLQASRVSNNHLAVILACLPGVAPVSTLCSHFSVCALCDCQGSGASSGTHDSCQRCCNHRTSPVSIHQTGVSHPGLKRLYLAWRSMSEWAAAEEAK